jgi:glycerol-3-phosphate dehydrogenase
MKTITIIGAGMMGSALAFPARENGNTVRIVGTPLDREIIDTCRATGRHPKFVKDFPAGITYYQFEELQEALPGTDFVICGVSSFGVEWYAENVLPVLPENLPMISVTKGLMDLEDGTLITYLDYWQQKLDQLGKKLPLVLGIIAAILGVLAVFTNLGVSYPWLTIGIPAIPSLYFDWFGGCIQAFIFCTLTTLFIKQAAGD